MQSQLTKCPKAATDCTSQNATPLDALIGAGDGGGAGILTKANGLIGSGTKRDITYKITNIIERASSLQCADAELCLSIQSAPFCYNTITFNFHDGQGTTGNTITGNYRLADGRTGNLYAGPYPIPTGTNTVAPTRTQTGPAVQGTGPAVQGTGPRTGAGTGAGTGGGRPSPTATGNAGVQDRPMAYGGYLGLFGILLL
jgi:hypothetical protein